MKSAAAAAGTGAKRGPGRPSAAALALPGAGSSGSRVHTLSAGDLLSRMGKWRDSLNPLRGLTPQGVTRMVEDAQRGAQSDLQWLLKWIEDEDAVYGAIVERSLAALSGLDWDVLIPEHLEGAELSAAQAQQEALKDFYNSLRGLRESIEELGMARFRGCAFLEKCFVGGQGCLDPVPPEYFVRDGRAAPWVYSANAASGTVTGTALEEGHWVIREFARPVGRKAARLYLIKNLSIKDWQGFAEVFGVPAIFFIMPEGITPEARGEFQAIAEQIVSEARGALPAGTDVKTVEAKAAGTSPFKELADWCDQQLVIAGTGGYLTMLSAPGSGTLAGSAHQEAFDLIARREAVLVSGIFQDQVDRPFLHAKFPGQPVYAYWQLSAADENDPDKVVQQVKVLKDAGYTVSRAQVEEKTGYELEEATEDAAGKKQEGEKEPQPKPAPPEPEPDKEPVNNREPAALPVPVPVADTAQKARKAVAAALDEDFGGIRTQLESLMEMDPASPDYAAGLAVAQRMIDLLAGAEPGALAADEAFADMTAAALLGGWTAPTGQSGE